MERIAFILGSRFISWPSVMVTLGALCAVCIFLGLYLKHPENTVAAFVVLPLAAALSLAAARFVHWYCFPGSYESMETAFSQFASGGYALVGAFAGCLAAALLTRIVFLHRNLPRMLDCMCLAGCAGIAVGRLASFFDSSDRGQVLETIQSMPWAYPVVNTVSGATEYRLATFLLQAIMAGVLFLVLTLVYLVGRNRKLRDGDTTLLFLLCYCASQVVLDSTRYDSIYFRSNGFVSIVQVLSAVALGMVIVVFSVRMVRSRGFRKWYLVLWAALAALIGGAGYMEYHVQRHGNEAAFAYSVMSICLCLVVAIAVFFHGFGSEKKKAPGRYLRTGRN